MWITHFTFYDVNIDDLTHEELLTLTSQINYKSSSELENLLYEAERVGKGDVLKRHGNRMLKTDCVSVWTRCHRPKWLLPCTMQQENDQNVRYLCNGHKKLAESSL